MHDLDSLARSLVRPAHPPHRRADRCVSTLSRLVAVGCALLPLGAMVEAVRLTA